MRQRVEQISGAGQGVIMREIIVLFCLFGFLCSIPAHSNTIHIDCGGSGDYITIESGVLLADSGDTVLVSAGIYPEPTLIIQNSIYLISESGAENTIIYHFGSPGDPYQCVLFVSGAIEGMISGFTIRGGNCDLASSGGGIKISDSNVIVSNNIITDNYCASGAGIVVWGYAPTITNNLIYCNAAMKGGGIEVIDGSPVITNNTIVDNSATWDVAAIDVLGSSSIPVIKYNLICYNSGPTSYCGGVKISSVVDSFVLECNNIWHNWPDGSDYCGSISDQIGINGNISEDPLFCGERGSFNYYLQQDSPCAEGNVPEYCNGNRIGYYPVNCIVGNEKNSWGSIKSIKGKSVEKN